MALNGLYAEQLSGSPFTAPRVANERSWLYRIRPTVKHWGRFENIDPGLWCTAPCTEYEMPIAPLRWDPTPMPKEELTFLQGIRTVTTAGDAAAAAGMGVHVYLITKWMVDEYFYNADGEMMFLPEQGNLRICTEFGIIDVEPCEVAIIPRGVKIRVELKDNKAARGYLCENYGGAFTLPERGPIGANCMANQRDFLTPVAAYEDRETPSAMYVKWGGTLWRTEIKHRPNFIRSRRPIDLHGADVAVGNTGNSKHRFRRVLRPLDGGREHLPSAVVPHERHVRIYGPDSGSLRCQTAGLRAGRHDSAQHHAATRSRRRGVRACEQHGVEASATIEHHGLHARDALPATRNQICCIFADIAAQLR